jgi:hypothetical protein
MHATDKLKKMETNPTIRTAPAQLIPTQNKDADLCCMPTQPSHPPASVVASKHYRPEKITTDYRKRGAEGR